MKRAVVESWILLLLFEFLMRFRNFDALYAYVRGASIRQGSSAGSLSAKELCHAMDLACVFYFKTVLCLQHSAATTILLRRHGYDAAMVTGTQTLPFKAHAWVEVDGAIVNDKPYMHDIYQVLDRC